MQSNRVGRSQWAAFVAVVLLLSLVAYAALADGPSGGSATYQGDRPIPVEPNGGIGDTPIPGRLEG